MNGITLKKRITSKRLSKSGTVHLNDGKLPLCGYPGWYKKSSAKPNCQTCLYILNNTRRGIDWVKLTIGIC